MWWEPRTEAEREVSAFLDRMDRRFWLMPPTLVAYGVASYAEEPVPLVIASNRLDPRPDQWSSQLGSLGSWIVRLTDRLAGPLPSPTAEAWNGELHRDRAQGSLRERLRVLLSLIRALRSSRRKRTREWLVSRFTVSLEAADPVTARLLRQLEPPTGTLIGYMGDPETLSRAKAVVRKGSRRSTTAGFVLQHQPSGGPLYVGTAAHLGAQKGEGVLVRRRRRLIPWGDVARGHVVMPCGPPCHPPDCIDLAIIRVDWSAQSTSSLLGATLSRAPAQLMIAPGRPVVWRGARTGPSHGTIVTPLRVITIEGAPYRQTFLIESPTRKGDSGSLVLEAASNACLGMLIARTGTLRRRGVRNLAIVQSVDAIEGPLRAIAGAHYVLSAVK